MKKFAKYALLAVALLTPVVAYAASVAGDCCDSPCCPVKAKK